MYCKAAPFPAGRKESYLHWGKHFEPLDSLNAKLVARPVRTRDDFVLDVPPQRKILACRRALMKESNCLVRFVANKSRT